MSKRQHYTPANYLEARTICGDRVEDALYDIMQIMSKTILGKSVAPLEVLLAAVHVSRGMLKRRLKIEERRERERKASTGNA
ncbi:MAG: hypothetical protein CVU73_14960 [Deltaproteobacteria bacterium HGW-Deltaproteobacteria-8]|nr:MAG: hypothetical protein CVU73_14960 [Deltaproteobacteria bacterium HGW-Deltaproteobacteria-8]